MNVLVKEGILGAIWLIMGVLDRLYIDWYWVGRTKAWIIPGTEDLMPCIPAKVHLLKWVYTPGALPGLRCAGLLDRQPVFVISRGAVMKFQTVGEARRVSGWHGATVREGLQTYGVDRFTTQTGRSLSQPR